MSFPICIYLPTKEVPHLTLRGTVLRTRSRDLSAVQDLSTLILEVKDPGQSSLRVIDPSPPALALDVERTVLVHLAHRCLIRPRESSCDLRL